MFLQNHRKLAAVAASVLAVSGGGAAVVTAASAADGQDAAPAKVERTAGPAAAGQIGAAEGAAAIEVTLEADGSMAIQQAEGPAPAGSPAPQPTSPAAP